MASSWNKRERERERDVRSDLNILISLTWFDQSLVWPGFGHTCGLACLTLNVSLFENRLDSNQCNFTCIEWIKIMPKLLCPNKALLPVYRLSAGHNFYANRNYNTFVVENIFSVVEIESWNETIRCSNAEKSLWERYISNSMTVEKQVFVLNAQIKQRGRM